MEDLFEGYTIGPWWDEMLESPSYPRKASLGLHEALRSLSAADLEERCAERDRSFRDRGITFSLSGEERPFPLDPVPRLVSADEWAVIESGVAQRVRALEMFLADVYGRGEVLKDGVVPRRLVATSRHFHRAAAGIETPNGVRIHVSGIDLVRDATGEFRVLEDNLRIPSGVSYVVENRRTMARVFPELFVSHRVRPVADYPDKLLASLKAASPRRARGEPTVVVLTPGVHNAAYFEHSFLARQMGVELVEGRDLVCRQNTLYMRTTGGEQRVDVVYRRIDDDYLDPLHFRSDSLLGSAGLLNVARAGNVTIANAVGNGVADDKLAYTYVPALIDYYLGERPILANVPTYRLEEPDQLEHVLGRIGELVLKPVDASGGYGLLIGPQASEEEIDAAAVAIRANPRSWVAQEVVQLSTVPTKVGNHLEPRHVDLRPFAINDGERVWVLPGGLTRVALPRGSLVVNSSQGGGSKDTWVLASDNPHFGGRDVDGVERTAAAALAALPPYGAGPDLGPALAANQQQQQSGPPCSAG
ncbi:MAG: hypothetical protein JWO62_2397 [Acidimicrobiaceae bacterium]|nr:hypothetical protein [Acidimicrobiaceae bacterium]